jgi:hypothetical protein
MTCATPGPTLRGPERGKALRGILLLPLLFQEVGAGEFRDLAEVLRVEPLRRVETRIHREQRCTPARRPEPPVADLPGADMQALLGWNAAPETTQCREVRIPRNVERIQGYRVTYRYRGQVFTRVLDHAPGRTMPVRVRLHAAGP